MRARLAQWLGLDPTGVSSLLISQPAALALGFVASIWLLLRAGKSMGLRQREVAELLIAAYLGALVAGRFLDMLTWGADFWSQPWRIADPWFGGASTLGGLLGATAGVVWLGRRRGLDIVRFLDAAAPVGGVTVALFKSGCFLAGCCYGQRSDGLLGLRFPASSLVYYHQVGLGLIDSHYHDSLPVLPVQLFEAGWGLLVALGLWGTRPWLRQYAGGSFTLGAMLLLGGRTGIEALRGGQVATMLGLTAGQITCIFFMLVLVLVWWGPWREQVLTWLRPGPAPSPLSLPAGDPPTPEQPG
ncbi:MAG: prolipoprotein diacylglyceryl transferase family protein [Pseudomonadota bacterium]